MQRTSVYLAINPDAPVWFTPRTGSTMDDARELIRSAPLHGTTVVTDFQRSGRGRREGRRWLAPAGTSLMATISLIDDPEPATVSLALAAALAAELDSRLPEPTARVRWPNDILVRGRKIAGILADYEPPWIYLGFGVNLLQEEFPPEIAEIATSLAIELGRNAASPRLPAPVDWSDWRFQFLQAIVDRFVQLRSDWREELLPRLWGLDESVEVAMPGGERVRGTIVGLEPDGRLVLDSGSSVHRLAAGEVSLHRATDR